MLKLLLLELGMGGLAEDEAAASRGCWAPRLPLWRLLLLPLLSGSCATLLSLLLLLLLLGSAYEEAPLPEEKLDDEARDAEHLRVVLAIDAASSGVDGWPGGAAAAKAALTAARVQETSHRPCSSSSSDEWSRPSSTASSARACRTFSAKDSLRDMMPEDADHRAESSSCMGPRAPERFFERALMAPLRALGEALGEHFSSGRRPARIFEETWTECPSSTPVHFSYRGLTLRICSMRSFGWRILRERRRLERTVVLSAL